MFNVFSVFLILFFSCNDFICLLKLNSHVFTCWIVGCWKSPLPQRPLTAAVPTLGVCPRRWAGELLQGVWCRYPALWIWWKRFQVRWQGHSSQAVRLNVLPLFVPTRRRADIYYKTPIDCQDLKPTVAVWMEEKKVINEVNDNSKWCCFQSSQ